MKEFMLNFYLLWGTGQDIKERKISNLYLIVGMVGGLVFSIFNILKGDFVFGRWIVAWTPGIIFMVLAKVLKEKIGMGDGLVLLILGNFYGVKEICLLLQLVFVFLTIFSIALLCSKKVSGEYQIPFLPFLWMTHMLLWGLHYV